MPFPLLDEVLIKLLKTTKEEKEYNTERAIRLFAREYELTTEETEMTFADSSLRVLRELVRFGRDHLRGAGLIEGFNKSFKVTRMGLMLLKTKPEKITLSMLKEYSEYSEFWKEYSSYHREFFPQLEKTIKQYNEKIAKKSQIKETPKQNKITQPSLFKLTPEEEIEKIFREHTQKLRLDLLNKVKGLSPSQFEDLCIGILMRLCYHKDDNVKIQDVAKALGKTGDGGIDGIIIKKDKIKESKIYIQAKCWKDSQVGRPEIQKFVGALVGQKARDGIFMTTSGFANTAKAYANEQNGYDIKLIDGEELIDLMLEYEIGVQCLAKFEIKTLDTEFFLAQRKQVSKNNRF